MPRKSDITPADIQWLRVNHTQSTYTSMARHVGVCVDTLKRILAREGIKQFDAAKYEPSLQLQVQYWDRPCTNCRSRERRHKWQYFCSKCARHYGLSRED